MNIANLEEASDKIDEYELRKRSRHVQSTRKRHGLNGYQSI